MLEIQVICVYRFNTTQSQNEHAGTRHFPYMQQVTSYYWLASLVSEFGSFHLISKHMDRIYCAFANGNPKF